MRLLRSAPVAGAVVLLGLLFAGPAAAQPDHFHLDLALAGCGEVKATAYELPKSARLDIRIQNAANGATLKRATVTTGKDGSLTLDAKVPLTGVRTVRATVARAGAAKPFAFSELTIPGECPLPFTGPTQAPAMGGLGLCLIAVGAMLVGVSASRGRRRAGRLAGR